MGGLRQCTTRSAFDQFPPCWGSLFLNIAMPLVAVMLSGCTVPPLVLTWRYPLAPSSPRPLVWKGNWPASAGQAFPILFSFYQRHRVKVQMQPTPGSAVTKEWGSFNEPQPLSGSDAFAPGSTTMWLTLPEGREEYGFDAATGELSVISKPQQAATQP